ncbi:MAG: hypothetical protein LBT33_02000 [Spirochaetia bacterium]|jgi:hypothetical protein|nr:hypothetical protein [Spirochaetia bacterium]
MVLEKNECIALYVFLKAREDELSAELEEVMERCKGCVYDHLSAVELERLLEDAAGPGRAE